jgi:hypothetical protein
MNDPSIYLGTIKLSKTFMMMIVLAFFVQSVFNIADIRPRKYKTCICFCFLEKALVNCGITVCHDLGTVRQVCFETFTSIH